jgi:hypothetical protein
MPMREWAGRGSLWAVVRYSRINGRVAGTIMAIIIAVQPARKTTAPPGLSIAMLPMLPVALAWEAT